MLDITFQYLNTVKHILTSYSITCFIAQKVSKVAFISYHGFAMREVSVNSTSLYETN